MRHDAGSHQQAIAELPGAEKTSPVAWLNEEDPQAWDKQIEGDFSEGGAGIARLQKWGAEIKAGGSVPREELLAQRQTAHQVSPSTI